MSRKRHSPEQIINKLRPATLTVGVPAIFPRTCINCADGRSQASASTTCTTAVALMRKRRLTSS